MGGGLNGELLLCVMKSTNGVGLVHLGHVCLFCRSVQGLMGSVTVL